MVWVKIIKFFAIAGVRHLRSKINKGQLVRNMEQPQATHRQYSKWMRLYFANERNATPQCWRGLPKKDGVYSNHDSS
jgi:hypothetical protein